jgi:hypothetical protein
MYYAVFIGGPKWFTLIPGNNCGSIDNCINMYNALSASERVIYQPERYHDIDDLEEKMRDMENLIDQKNISIDEIEKIAISQFPDNNYKIHGDTKIFNPKTGITQ